MDCKAVKRKKQVKSHNDKRAVTGYWRWWKYGVDQPTFERMLVDQNFKCALECCDKVIGIRTGYVDHNHETDSPRALICHGCNLKLVALDRTDYFEAAVKYLHKYDPTHPTLKVISQINAS